MVGSAEEALGTTSSDFVSASLVHLKAAAQFPGSGISEVGINAALAQIEALAPQSEVEAALAVQMACTHAAAMSVFVRFGGGEGSERRVIALASAAARLMRAYLDRWRPFVAYVTAVTSTSESSMSTSMKGDKRLSEMSKLRRQWPAN